MQCENKEDRDERNETRISLNKDELWGISKEQAKITVTASTLSTIVDKAPLMTYLL